MLNKIINGDCLEIMKDIPDESIDFILTDVPYGTTACRWDSVIPFEPMWQQLNRVIKKNRAIVLFGSEPFSSALIMSNVKEYKATWYWRKERGTNFVQAKRYPMRVIEHCLVFCKGTPKYNPKLRDVKPYSHVLPNPANGESQHMDSDSTNTDGSRLYKNYTTAYPVNVLEIARDNMSTGNSFHPTQKPVALMEYLIRTYTDKGETVLDFTIGSGTTAVAAIQTNRQFIGIEKETRYCDIAEQRIKKAYLTVEWDKKYKVELT